MGFILLVLRGSRVYIFKRTAFTLDDRPTCSALLLDCLPSKVIASIMGVSMIMPSVFALGWIRLPVRLTFITMPAVFANADGTAL